MNIPHSTTGVLVQTQPLVLGVSSVSKATM